MDGGHSLALLEGLFGQDALVYNKSYPHTYVVSTVAVATIMAFNKHLLLSTR